MERWEWTEPGAAEGSYEWTRDAVKAVIVLVIDLVWEGVVEWLPFGVRSGWSEQPEVFVNLAPNLGRKILGEGIGRTEIQLGPI